MGSVIPLKNSANSAYLDLRNLVANKLDKVEELINLKLESKVDLIYDSNCSNSRSAKGQTPMIFNRRGDAAKSLIMSLIDLLTLSLKSF